ncbi:MAG: ribosome silencing factor [Lentisphaerae bacterium]|nr:ribosome silencing factor [Lentisphaerota bacterium]
MAEKQTLSGLEIARLARSAAQDKKGADIVILDVRGLSSICDYCLFVSGDSPPQLKALVNEIQHALKQRGVPCFRRGGQPESGWITLDYVDAVIHVFLPRQREYYAIESLWEEAPRLP